MYTRSSVISKTHETVHPQVIRKTRPTRNVSLCAFAVSSIDLTILACALLLFVCALYLPYIDCRYSIRCWDSLHCTISCRKLGKSSNVPDTSVCSKYVINFLSQAHSENLDIKIATESGETFTLQLTLNK